MPVEYRAMFFDPKDKKLIEQFAFLDRLRGKLISRFGLTSREAKEAVVDFGTKYLGQKNLLKGSQMLSVAIGSQRIDAYRKAKRKADFVADYIHAKGVRFFDPYKHRNLLEEATKAYEKTFSGKVYKLSPGLWRTAKHRPYMFFLPLLAGGLGYGAYQDWKNKYKIVRRRNSTALRRKY